MQENKWSLFCAFLLYFAWLCDGGYAPTDWEERNLKDCLLRRRSATGAHTCGYYEKRLHTNRRAKSQSFCKHNLYRGFTKRKKGSISKTAGDLDVVEEYVCALVDYNNLRHKTHREIRRLTESIGSCTYIFDSIIPAWKRFLNKRKYESVTRSPIMQRRRGQVITAKFAVADDIHRSILNDIKAVDLVISRSKKRDVEVYGKYNASIFLRSKNGVFVSVHESLQTTCSSNFKRSFVLGFNEAGLKIIESRLADGVGEIELRILLNPLTQITRAVTSGRNRSYEANEFDIEEKVSAIVFHQINTNSNDFFSQASRDRRSVPKRSDGNCRRERYMLDYSKHESVIRPTEFDLGECVGSCDDAFLTNLNSTNHALTMQSEMKTRKIDAANPEPTICCIPISYRKFYYITQDGRGALMVTYADNMVSDYCGCR